MPRYLDFTVSLQGVLPRPWRRFQLASTASFAGLSAAIQDACGWSGGHMWAFRESTPYESAVVAGVRIGDGDDDLLGPVPDAKRVKVGRYFGPDRATSCLYVYDFGDDWVHDVLLNDIVTERGTFARRLLGGEHPFPPDDCGGAPGYADIQDAQRSGRDPEGLLAWARDIWQWSGTFDPDAARLAFDR